MCVALNHRHKRINVSTRHCPTRYIVSFLDFQIQFKEFIGFLYIFGNFTVQTSQIVQSVDLIVSILAEMSSCSRLCTLMVHTHSHCAEDMMLNSDLFYDYEIGDIVQIYDHERTNDRLILKVMSMPPTSGRLEISLSKVVAESLSFKPFSKVVVEKISEEQASVNFVEFVFKRQYLQRGNMWRFKKSMFGKSVHMGQNLSINGMQAQILQLRNKSSSTTSGIITEKTKFVFRSRSSRIIWLVQISAEMWEFDQVCVVYFLLFFSIH